jgi:hypothetical protein
MSASAPLLICYDGSPGAVEAMTFAARVQPGAGALVVTEWKPIVEEMLAGPGEARPISDPVEANEGQRRAAVETGRDGARRATAAGLDAEPVVNMAEEALREAIEKVAIERAPAHRVRHDPKRPEVGAAGQPSPACSCSARAGRSGRPVGQGDGGAPAGLREGSPPRHGHNRNPEVMTEWPSNATAGAMTTRRS